MNTIMKRVNKIRENILIGIVLLILSPIILLVLLPWFVIYGIPLLYAHLWAKIRHDPRVKLDTSLFEQLEWSEKRSTKSYVQAFDTLCKSITEASGATINKTTYTGFDTIPLSQKENYWHILIVEKTLRRNKSVILLNFEFGMSGTINDEGYVGFSDSDDENDMPLVKASFTIGGTNSNINMRLYAPEDVWFLIGFVRGDYCFNSKSKQLWVFIKEHNIWIVRYRLMKNEYGFRSKHTETRARRYSLDSNIKI